MKKAVVLLSGGLDSATALYWAKSRGYRCVGLNFEYGQRHSRERKSARKIAQAAKIPLHEVSLSLPWLQSSSLVNHKKKLPDLPLSKIGRGIPSTYVPGRNTVFVSIAVSLADSIGAEAIVIGANAYDFSGYPDCRPEYYRAFQKVAQLGTQRGSEGKRTRILAPLVSLNKAQIIQLARRLKASLQYTWSCYAGGLSPCGKCDSCKLRAKGFREAGLLDPALEKTN